MLTKKEQRLRRARQTRIRIANQGVARLTVNRTNLHIYASVISGDGFKVLASVWLKRPRRLVLKKLRLIVQALRIMAASRRWQMQHVKLACSSKQIGN